MTFQEIIGVWLPSHLFIIMRNLPFCSCGAQLSDYRNVKCWACYTKAHPSKLPPEVKRERRRKYKSKWFQKNKNRLYENYLKQLNNSPEKIKAQRFKYYIKSKFGIDIDTYNQMLLTHNYQCAICDYKQPEHASKHDKLYVDHNHSNGKVRGLLCMNCNSAIGHFKENLTFLENAVNYLKNYEKSCNNTENQGNPSAQ